MSASTGPGPGGLLAVWVTAPDEIARDFVTWYETEHLPERAETDGFRSAMLFQGVEDPTRYMALYELDSPRVIDSPAYREIKARPYSELSARVRAGWRDHERIVYDLAHSTTPEGRRPTEYPYAFSVRLHVHDGWAEKYRDWLREEHVPRMLGVDGVGAHQGYEPTAGPHHFLNLWGLERPTAVGSDEWEAARATPWKDRLAEGRGEAIRGMYRPLLGS